MAYEHLRLEREAPSTERHPRRHPGIRPPADPRAHGAALAGRLDQARQRAMAEDVGGFDDRKLLKIRLRAGDKSVPAFDAIPGVEIVSQEDESIVLAFATDDGLSEFESRLATLARDGVVTRKELFYVIEDFDHWTPQDRTGAALLEQGFPASPGASFTPVHAICWQATGGWRTMPPPRSPPITTVWRMRPKASRSRSRNPARK